MRVFLYWIAFAGFALISVLHGQSLPKPVAVVNGEVITEDDLARVAGGRIRQAANGRDPSQSDASFEREKLAIRWDALNNLIERKLARAEAARLMISEDDLIENEIDRATEMPTREVVTAFTEANRVRMPLLAQLPPFEVFSQVRAFMTLRANRAVRVAYFERLAKQYDVKTYLPPLTTEIATEGHPVRGTEGVSVTIVEFSDFECPECATLTQTLKALQEANRERVRLVYRQFPLAHVHAHAQKAAEASLCAHHQQHFWEFHDSLFRDQKALDTDDLKKRAATLGLDTAAFNACLDSGTQIKAVDKDIDAGYKAQVLVAPTLFINGRMLSGNRTAVEIQQIVDDELQRVKQ